MIGVMLADADSHDLTRYGTPIKNEEDADKRYIQVPASEVTSITARILADLPVHDITITDPPVEDVIEQAFRE
jgi:ABC-2 type transport system ATP-binding protein